MSDDFYPPHVFDQTPLDTLPQEKAGIFARRFLNAAQQFRNPSGKLERLHLGNERYAEFPAGLKEQCGVWLIEAHKLGLIPDAHKELRELIAWHVADGSKGNPPGRESTYMRCSSNLFSDLCGGNMVMGNLRGEDARGRIIFEDSRNSGGLMPRIAVGHLDLPHKERCAATCEWLADLIERAAAAPTKQGEGEKPPADPFAELREFAHAHLKGQGRAVIEALCAAGGELPLADVKTLCDWQDPIDDTWNSLRQRLNAKIIVHSWKLVTHDRKARLEHATRTSAE
jgi:hypothetical protein